ncbi:MAG: LuxR C-terminal-related transcriptional regulator [Blastocatellia bacterium]
MPKKKEIGLTKKQLDVLKLLVNGYDGREVGEMLNLKQSTVETYRFIIMLKLGINNLAGLVKYGIKHNLTTLDKDRDCSIVRDNINND